MIRLITVMLWGVISLMVSMAAAARPVLLISIDGLRPADILEAQQRGLKLPNLRRFLSDGSYASDVRGVLPTLTYPSHTTLLTGVSPGLHGIAGNYTFDPTNTNQQGWYWYASDIRVPTLWDVVHAAGKRVANVHWPVSVGEASIDDNLPQIWRTGSPDDRKLLAALATPGLLPALEKELGPYADGIAEDLPGDINRARFAEKLLEKHKPYFMTVYLTALDTEQHADGPDTPASRQTLESIDTLIGDLLAIARRVHPDGVVAVVSDHGFAPVQRDVNLYLPFIKAGLITLQNGKVTNWQAMPWNDGGSAAIVLHDPANAGVKAKVAALLDQLQADPQLGIAQVFSHDQVLAQGGTPLAAWFVQFKLGSEMAGTADAPLVAPSRLRGMHGYAASLPEMRSTFLIEGAGVAAGRSLGAIDMRDIAPTLAAIMGVALPQAQGHELKAISVH